MQVTKEFFTKSGKDKGIYLFTLSNDNGLVVKITNFGATVTSITMPDKYGNPDELVMGFDFIEDYEKGHPYFGSICGRYANRIAKGQFTLDGTTYHLPINNAPNSLHGGNKGFDKVIWDAQPIETTTEVGVLLTYLSKDGEEGYPGNLTTEVRYILNNQNELNIFYKATTDKPTVINLTNHSYFNLGGCHKNIYSLELMINADKITEFDDTNIPTGKFLDVANTPLDFRKPVSIGEKISRMVNGFDHNYVLNKVKDGELSLAATVYDLETGRFMEVYTTEPGIQFYSANYVDGTLTGHKGIVYQKHGALCLETQHFPDSPNHPHFPSTVLRPGEIYSQHTIYKFSIK